MIYLLYATHTLQPLDVVMFKSLSSCNGLGPKSPRLRKNLGFGTGTQRRPATDRRTTRNAGDSPDNHKSFPERQRAAVWESLVTPKPRLRNRNAKVFRDGTQNYSGC
jgi:hypothetical protein